MRWDVMKRLAHLLTLIVCLPLGAEGDHEDLVEEHTGPSAWVTLPEGVLPVADALRLVAVQSTRRVEGVDLPAGKALHSDGRPRPLWQALDEVASAAGVGLQLEGTDRITQAKEPEPELRARYEGAFRVKLGGVMVSRSREYRAPSRTSEMSVSLTLGWEPHVRVLAIGPFQIEEAIDEDGESLLPGADPRRSRFLDRWRDFGGSGPCRGISVKLAAPSEEARRIHLLRGVVGVLVERDATELAFEHPADEVGKTIECEGLTITLVAFKADRGIVHATIRTAGPPPFLAASGVPRSECGPISALRCTLRGGGKDLGEGGGTQKQGLDESLLDLSWWEVGDGPFVLALAVPMRALRRDLEVEFRDIDLP